MVHGDANNAEKMLKVKWRRVVSSGQHLKLWPQQKYAEA